MNSAPQRPAFVLLWIGVFTVVAGFGIGAFAPIEAAQDEAAGPQFEALPQRLELGTPAPETDDPFPPGADPARASAVSATYTAPEALRCELLGTVVDDTARPCPGARIELWLGKAFDRQERADRLAFAGPEGRFRLTGLPAAGQAVLVAVHNNVPSHARRVDLARHEASQLLRLEIDLSTATVRRLRDFDREVTASNPSYRDGLVPVVVPAAAAAALPPMQTVDLPAPGRHGMTVLAQRASHYTIGISDAPMADGTFLLVVAAGYDEERPPEEVDAHEEALDSAVEDLPPALQDLLSKAKREAQRATTSAALGNLRDLLLDRLKEAASQPKISAWIAKLSPRQAAKARTLLLEELRRRLKAAPIPGGDG